MTLDLIDAGLFTLAAVALLGSPGPGIAALVSVGRAQEFAGGLPFYWGLQAGLALAAALSAAGLFSLIRALPYATAAMTASATLYLAYLAWKIATAPVGVREASGDAPAVIPGLVPKSDVSDFGLQGRNSGTPEFRGTPIGSARTSPTGALSGSAPGSLPSPLTPLPQGRGEGTTPATVWGGFLLGASNPKAYLAFVSLMAAHALVPEPGPADAILKWFLCVLVMLAVDLAWLRLGAALGALALTPKAERALNIAMGVVVFLTAVVGVFS